MDELQQIVDAADGYAEMCPVCLCGLERGRKAEHLERVHGYETLLVRPLTKAEKDWWN
jgi:hypothetical protein